MCQGTTTHILNGSKVILEAGDLLFLNQNAEQEILPAGEQDIAVNFIVLPEFLIRLFHDGYGGRKCVERISGRSFVWKE